MSNLDPKYADLINELLSDPRYGFLGPKIAKMSIVTDGDIERLLKAIMAGDDKLAFAMILDRISENRKWVSGVSKRANK